jgi:serine/threonine-protein kinase HipA
VPRHQHAVIWTRVAGSPQKMGSLVRTPETVSMTYTDAYLNSSLPGLSLLADQRLHGQDTIVYPIDEQIPVLPRLLALIPGNNPRNIQRQQFLRILQQQRGGTPPPPTINTEWELLLLGGHGGIGHIDVFPDDLAAEQWYEKPAARSMPAISTSVQSSLWRMIKRDVLDMDGVFEEKVIEDVLGPTPSVGGMIPKLLVSIGTGPDQPVTIHPPGMPGMTEVILKIEPPEYAGLLDLEALCLDLHREAGFQVPEYHRFDIEGLRFLAIERFDIDDQEDLPIPMESFFSIIATGRHDFRVTGDILLDELGTVIDQLSTVVSLPNDTNEQLYRRLLMALLTGNGDMHLDNLAFIGGLDDCQLSPVYDPAPMRAWPRHNLVSAIPFDAAEYQDHGEFFVHLGDSFGLRPAMRQQCIEEALEATEIYLDRLMLLKDVPDVQKQNLERIVSEERQLMKRGIALRA